MPTSPVVLDTNVFINALAGRGPPVLQTLLSALPRAFVAAPTMAELSWVRGRLDPAHPGNSAVLSIYASLLERIAPAKVLVPGRADWLAAGEFSALAARRMSGGGRKIATDAGGLELVSDSLIAILARKAGFTIVTADTDFAVLAECMPGLLVLFYERVGA